MIKTQWNPEDEILIQVGDLINKGTHSHKVLRLVFELQKKYPTRTVFLKGNHEWFLYNYLSKYAFTDVKAPFVQNIKAEKLGITELELKNWLHKMPLYWQNDFMMVSHAGLVHEKYLLTENQAHAESTLHNRRKIKANIKLQVVGHVVQNQTATFYAKENCWRIDTGTWLGKHLTGLRLSSNGNLIEVVKQPTDPRDLNAGKPKNNWLPIMELYNDF